MEIPCGSKSLRFSLKRFSITALLTESASKDEAVFVARGLFDSDILRANDSRSIPFGQACLASNAKARTLARACRTPWISLSTDTEVVNLVRASAIFDIAANRTAAKVNGSLRRAMLEDCVIDCE